MITYSIIKKSELEGALRLDAEYYQQEYFIDFSKGNWVSLGDCLEKCQYGLSLAMNDEEIGYPIYKMDDIKFGFLFKDNVRYAAVNPKEAENYFLEKNDIFFNRVNSDEFVGRTGIFKGGPKSVFASYLIRIRPDNKKILSDYLNIFLNSAYGFKQIQKFKRRALNQANVNAEELKQFKVLAAPISFQKEIEKLSNKSWENFEDSKRLYGEAEKVLLEELGLKDFEEKESLFSVVNLSDVKNAKRMDAEYFQDKFEDIFSRIKSGAKISKFSDIATLVRGSLINPKYYSETEGIPYIRGGDFSSGKLEKQGLIYIKDFKNNHETMVSNGDIVFALIGSVGTSALVDKNFENSFISNNIGRISINNKKEILPEYLGVILQSIIGKSQFEKEASQTAQPKISDSQVGNFYVPILSNTKQEKIAELVKKSHVARKKAKNLLEEAKVKVEKLIEK